MSKRKMRGAGFLMFLVLLSFILSGCKLGKSNTAVEEIRIGNEGIVMSFLPNTPPDNIRVDISAPADIEVALEVKNKGAYPQPEDGIGAPSGKIYISGYDESIVFFPKKEEMLDTKPLEGKSTVNPNGGLDVVSFSDGKIITSNMVDIDRYEPIIQATACYEYVTIASSSVCVDPNPYTTANIRKVCQATDIPLSSQGAPIAITGISVKAFAKKTQFRINIKNIGNGDIIKKDRLSMCSPSTLIKRDDIDKITVDEVSIGRKQLTCSPMSGRELRVINGETFMICDLTEFASDSAYLTPIKIKLSYGYRNTIEKKMTIKRESTGSASSPFSGSAPP